jgi:hypothetical protein
MRQSARRVLTDSSDLRSSRGDFSLPGGSYSLTAVPAKAEASATGLELSVNSWTAVDESGSERVNHTPNSML